LFESFASLWNARPEEGRESEPRVRPISPPAQAGDATLQIVQSAPPHTLPDIPSGDATILESYLRAIAQAREFVYLETQYFTSATIVRALGRALERRAELQVILVVNEDTDVPGYTRWQKRRLAELGHPDHPRLGAFTLWRVRPGDEPEAHPIYIHSKIAIVDDVWATVGTANLDSISMEPADEFAVAVECNIDVNAVILDGVDGAPRTGHVARLRRQLWAEHLGDAAVWSQETARDGGWLGVWRRAAEDNLRAWRAGLPLRGHALPYLPAELARRVAE
jgi:phosphatidylserine/phosphatidylglycerophosphate/cardiolipin synthase-like enzyme